MGKDLNQLLHFQAAVALVLLNLHFQLLEYYFDFLQIHYDNCQIEQ